MAPESSVGKLDAILEQVAEHRDDFREFRIEVFGSAKDEKPTGRLPRLEATSENHEKRIVRLERIVLLLIGAAGLLKALAWSAESMVHIAEVFRGAH